MTSDQAGLRHQLDYEQMEAAVMETARGRWFLAEYARRHRSADTEAILRELARLESSIRKQEPALPPIPAEAPAAATKHAESAPARSPAMAIPLDPPLVAFEPKIGPRVEQGVEQRIKTSAALPPVHIPPAVAAQLDALLARLADREIDRSNLAPIAAFG